MEIRWDDHPRFPRLHSTRRPSRDVEIAPSPPAAFRPGARSEGGTLDPPYDPEVATLLQGLTAGRELTATDEHQLFVAVYRDLRRIAAALLGTKDGDCTLRPTELVHEVYTRLVGRTSIDWTGKAHFLRVAAKAMRHTLVDLARKNAAIKRGGGWFRVTLDAVDAVDAAVPSRELEVLALERALTKLQEEDERMARVVELRVFAGLTGDETARVLGISRRTVHADWQVARLWLAREMGA